MKKAIVVTYCTWTSLGSMLQAFGLKKALQSLGCESRILLEDGANRYQRGAIHSLKSLVIRIFDIFIEKKRRAAFEKRMGFIRQHLDVVTCATEQLPTLYGEVADAVFLSGSDQIWNPTSVNPVFFLDFVKNGRRISYAASMGNTVIPPEKLELFSSMLNKYDRISVREDTCAKVLQPLTEIPISVHIDPTFLISSKEWRDLEVAYPIEEPYILLYMLFWDDAYAAQIRELKKKTGLKVYAIVNQLSRVCADRFLYDVGVGEFLWLFDHAAYVVTSSFHGVAFATIFNKRFAAVVNPTAPSRIQDLMERLQVPFVDITDLPDSDKFDYGTVANNIEKERSKSFAYLRESLQ